MPYPFTLPTTSAFSYSSSFTCDSHPSLPLAASTHRGVMRGVLKNHKRLPPAAQPANLPSAAAALAAYLPYLLAVDAGLAHRTHGDGSELFSIIQRAPPAAAAAAAGGLAIEWRPTLSSSSSPSPASGPARVRVHTLAHEVAFVLATSGYVSTLRARAALQPLAASSMTTATSSTTTTTTTPAATAATADLYAAGAPARQALIAAASKHLLAAASVYDYLARRAEQPQPTQAPPPPCADISAATARGQAHLALAEATLLAVLKDDPYPAVVAQDRNRNDTEWMFKAPDIPKVRVHLFARLCLAASEHAAKAHSLCAWQTGPKTGPSVLSGGIRFGKSKKGSEEGEELSSRGSGGGGKLNEGFVRYLEDLRRTSRAKACRFFGIDAELGGQTGDAIGWLHAAWQELGMEAKDLSKKSLGLSKLKKEWHEKREDRKVEKGTTWGADAGKLEEMRVIEMLEAKWAKQNETMFHQPITPPGTLLAQMPSAREIHTLKQYDVPMLDSRALEAMRAPPDGSDDFGDAQSSDEETPLSRPAPGSYPGSSTYY